MRRAVTVSAAALLAACTVSSAALAQHEHGMGPSSEAAPFGTPVADQHVWTYVIADQLELRSGRERSFHWDAEARIGTDTHRLWLKSEGEFADGVFAHGQHEAYYSRPVSPYFDLQAGLRYDLDSKPGRGWLAAGIEGLAPLFFHVAATAYASDRGHLGAKFTGSFDLLLTQRLILQPQAEFDLYSKADPARAIGSGLSEIETGLRLRYEITRKFAPYVGLVYERRSGATRTFAAAAGGHADAASIVAGLRIWF